MRITRVIDIILISGVLLVGMGCASKAPTIAHVHLGHVVDGWETTPGQTGLLETAEIFAQTSADAATRASKSDASLESRKRDIAELVKASHPEYSSKKTNPVNGKTQGVEFGVRTALLEAVHHIEFSANSDDASTNIRAGSKQFTINSRAVIDRCDLIAALGTDALGGGSSVEEVNLLATELQSLTQANLYGEDLNGDGVIGGQNAEEYGLKQLRVELQDMIARENPVYNTIEQWYLFNLIRLPSGDWVFRNSAEDTGGGSSYYY